MASPVITTVMIQCPTCGTRYQLPEGTISPQGRKVACAHCGEAWTAKPLPMPGSNRDDVMFDEEAEADLDAAFTEAEAEAAARASRDDPDREARERTLAEIRAAVTPAVPPAPAVPARPDSGLRKLQKDFRRRQDDINRHLPFARLRRLARVGGVAALVLLIGSGIVFRADIVRSVPDLAGVYETLGLGVNLVGLEFRDVTTLVAVRGGSRVMRVDAQIVSVASRPVPVPRVVVTLLDEAGQSLYEWSAEPAVNALEPGEIVAFTTQLTTPPLDASSVRLTFTDGRSGVDAPVPPNPETSEANGQNPAS